MIKPIKILTGEKSWDVKIDDKEITDSIFGIDIKLRVDSIPEVILHRYVSKVKYEGDNCNVKIISHNLKKVKGKNVLEDTNYSNCQNGKHFIKKEG